MRLTLVDLYTRHSARLAAHVADTLASAGADPIGDTDDITQETWLLAAQLLVLPEQDDAWLVLKGLAHRAAAQHMEAEHRVREMPSGVEAPAVRGLPPRPMTRCGLPDNTRLISRTVGTGKTNAETVRLAS
ncbi:hypothetical protein ACIOJD_33780 [Streptomyces sp. NPDC088116]|uniref:hypothetical protein n=1 Tax=Streptomyces sp. NPDC088116 TaxID=3365825 RepID=UPI0038118C88